MQLARVFKDYMVLQRQMPILIWGTSEKKERIEIKINKTMVCMADITAGEFSFLIPPQETAEDVLLEIGDICLEHVDIGEVWIAGGQSNMEFMMKYTEDGEREIASANDRHLRTYIVGQYSFAEEREAGYKAWNPWDRWLTYLPENAPTLPATAVYFAKRLRESGIPVGILSCNWGGTSASAWIKKECLSKDEVLAVYVDEFEEIVNKLDLDRYYAIKNMVRPAMASPQSGEAMGMILKNTFKPEELIRMMTVQAGQGSEPSVQAGQGSESSGQPRQESESSVQAGQESEPSGQPGQEPEPSDRPGSDKANGQGSAAMDISRLSMEEIRAFGPGEPNEPGTLYENMVREIAGFSARGVIWYQGETDENKAGIYERLFTALIRCWREEWKRKNAAVERMPFLFVQVAPFGTWMGNGSENYPVLRKQQELAAKKEADTYMTCISDIGNIYDIHPKNKRTVGERLALLAEKYVYGKTSILADAPEADSMTKEGDTLQIRFKNGQGLQKKETDFSSYNGFSCSEIDKSLLPPVLDGINGLKISADGRPVTDAVCRTAEDMLLIDSANLCNAEEICVEFAQTGFHQVNLYNEAGLPVKPFRLSLFSHSAM